MGVWLIFPIKDSGWYLYYCYTKAWNKWHQPVEASLGALKVVHKQGNAMDYGNSNGYQG